MVCSLWRGLFGCSFKHVCNVFLDGFEHRISTLPHLPFLYFLLLIVKFPHVLLLSLLDNRLLLGLMLGLALDQRPSLDWQLQSVEKRQQFLCDSFVNGDDEIRVSLKGLNDWISDCLLQQVNFGHDLHLSVVISPPGDGVRV